ncbi:hypothetical protein J3R30DRAFT_3507000 [Lentinula aciculospora]|uniref:Uncharacterized protein n=1 Tax=Lentinula aciculospora TaxID=153920 RepID=A0A9W9A4M9_9AGAR|nr:hypothetical protein J3R30DRAFT_3507000 [Lentinula aciculospora]
MRSRYQHQLRLHRPVLVVVPHLTMLSTLSTHELHNPLYLNLTFIFSHFPCNFFPNPRQHPRSTSGFPQFSNPLLPHPNALPLQHSHHLRKPEPEPVLLSPGAKRLLGLFLGLWITYILPYSYIQTPLAKLAGSSRDSRSPEWPFPRATFGGNPPIYSLASNCGELEKHQPRVTYAHHFRHMGTFSFFPFLIHPFFHRD